MKIPTSLCLLLSLLCFAACNKPAENEVTGLWNIDYQTIEPAEDELPESGIEGQYTTYTTYELTDALKRDFIVLNPDSTFFLQLGIDRPAVIGKYKFDAPSGNIDLQPTNGDNLKNVNLSFKYPNLICRTTVNPQDANRYEMRFQKNETKPYNTNCNFASYELNKWRIPTKKAQSHDEIVERLKQNYEFSITYLDYQAKYGKTNVFSSKPMMLPFFYARNGIQVVRNNEWDKLYFDKTEADSAYVYVIRAMRESNKKQIPSKYTSERPAELLRYMIDDMKDYLK